MTQLKEYSVGLWELLSTNSFVGALISGIAIILMVALISWCVKKYRAHSVYTILQSGLAEKNKKFLPTSYLCSKSSYTKAQVEALCSYHKNIIRNEKELEAWRIE